ncbi:hypothetical protein [Bradyrhizobium acaciae]|nr:hypothetical protein [Bradyrhizobium acaciae]
MARIRDLMRSEMLRANNFHYAWLAFMLERKKARLGIDERAD